jgi:hypothetical protein
VEFDVVAGAAAGLEQRARLLLDGDPPTAGQGDVPPGDEHAVRPRAAVAGKVDPHPGPGKHEAQRQAAR